MKIYKIAILISIVLLAICSQLVFSSNWRSVWDIKLTSKINRKNNIPTKLKIVLKNNSTQTVSCTNLIFDIYLEHKMLGWCYDKNIKNETITLSPNQTKKFKFVFKKMVFLDTQGKLLNINDVCSAIKKSKWTIKASISDMGTEKPKTESSFLVYSNTIKSKIE
jgi:hypothetical protein